MSRFLKHSFLIATTLLLLGTDKACVFQPTTDTIVTTSRVEIQGWIQNYRSDGKFLGNKSGYVRLFQNGHFIGTAYTDSKKRWKKTVALHRGVNRFHGQTFRRLGRRTIVGNIDPFLIEYKPRLKRKYRGTQNVYFDFSDHHINTQLQAIARHTLQAHLSPRQLNQFTQGVKNSIRSFFKKAYAGTQVRLVSSKRGPVHIVKFHGENGCNYYGMSPGDYLNRHKKQTSHIYIGTFKCVIVDLDRFLSSTPAKKTDSLQVRISDIGIYIGRTVAHEVGHSLGLTAEGEAKLHGCEGMHNCEKYDQTHPSNRFYQGFFIMDPGPKSRIYARAGFKTPWQRIRKYPTFNHYNKSYLKIIHAR